jgi:hypothetical protein
MAYVSQAMKAKLAPTIKSVLKKYKVKGSISVRNHMSLVVTLKEGAVNFGKDYADVNTYYIDDHYAGRARSLLNELKAAMEGPEFFCEDDAMTDYFHRSHYIDIDIGKWDKPYVYVA